ncbi:hypothetical protein L1049_020305 [Liquidambar formosana]|uniref:C2H2-type domain-containing protein n=1 Tax=Liquidambar formosana TaxID=63359 RepID=A0AAP0SDS9_LIQFO
MEKHRCKICYRRFANGRAMGGHMRSHLQKLPIPPKTQLQHPPSPSSSSSSSHQQGGEVRSLNQFLMEKNPMKYSFRSIDSDCTENHDSESDTDESPKNPTGKRSKRARKAIASAVAESPPAEMETASSVSDTICEEDVAFCLMMLSRDQWNREAKVETDNYVVDIDDDDDDEEDEEEEEDDDEDEVAVSRNRTRARTRGAYKCETCKKVFKSYQALGGHRASHKKIRPRVHDDMDVTGRSMGGGGGGATDGGVDRRIFECPFCFKVFDSGQALGGHKKVHLSNAANSRSSAKFGNNLIDLNLPAPEEDEGSTVSNAEVFHHS